jgi:hypothetical protein
MIENNLPRMLDDWLKTPNACAAGFVGSMQHAKNTSSSFSN